MILTLTLNLQMTETIAKILAYIIFIFILMYATIKVSIEYIQEQLTN